MELCSDRIDDLAQQVMLLGPSDRARMFKRIAAISRLRHRNLRSSEEVIQSTSCARALLTTREEQVLQLLLGGFATKEMATMLNISARTVERDRSAMMHKMLARNAADLCRIVAALDSDGAAV